MQRKEFIRNCSGLCLAGIGTSVLVQACVSANYFAKNTVQNQIISVAKSEFSVVRKNEVKKREYVLVISGEMQVPVCLFHVKDDEYSALQMLCTHQGCELTVSGQMLNCPCHGSDFDIHGNVLNPPADKNLTNYKVTTDEKNIYIHLR